MPSLACQTQRLCLLFFDGVNAMALNACDGVATLRFIDMHQPAAAGLA